VPECGAIPELEKPMKDIMKTYLAAGIGVAVLASGCQQKAAEPCPPPSAAVPATPAAEPASLAAGLNEPAVFKLDADHTVVGFRIKHLFSYVNGSFRKFEGSFEINPLDPAKSWVKAKIDAASIDTATPQRDEHLRSKDFFDVTQFPSITFESTAVKLTGRNKAEITGNLTIHGVTKPVVLDTVLGGVGKDPWGNHKAGLTATTKINRKDFGLGWNEALETGGVLVGEEVEITLEAEGMAETPAGKK